MRIETFSIVRLLKSKYNQEHITEQDPTPRLLVIKSFYSDAQCKVRYPDGYIQSVDWQDLNIRSMFLPDHPKYPELLRDMYAAVIEWNKGTSFVPWVREKYPQVALDIEQRTVHRNQQAAERHTQAPLATPIEVPTIQVTQDTSIELLRSIDNSLKTLIDLWGGKR